VRGEPLVEARALEAAQRVGLCSHESGPSFANPRHALTEKLACTAAQRGHVFGGHIHGLATREQLARDAKPLEAETWAAVVDTVGDKVLGAAIAQTRYEGIVAACGLAGGAGLPTTVMPFILRGVTLRGIDSVMASIPRRQHAWDRLAELVDPAKLARIYRVEPLARAPELAAELLAGKVQGRIVIDVNA